MYKYKPRNGGVCIKHRQRSGFVAVMGAQTLLDNCEHGAKKNVAGLKDAHTKL